MEGIIALAVVAILFSFVLAKVQRRLGVGRGKTLSAGVIVVFVLVVLALWTQS